VLNATARGRRQARGLRRLASYIAGTTPNCRGACCAPHVTVRTTNEPTKIIVDISPPQCFSARVIIVVQPTSNLRTRIHERPTRTNTSHRTLAKRSSQRAHHISSSSTWQYDDHDHDLPKNDYGNERLIRRRTTTANNHDHGDDHDHERLRRQTSTTTNDHDHDERPRLRTTTNTNTTNDYNNERPRRTNDYGNEQPRRTNDCGNDNERPQR